MKPAILVDTGPIVAFLNRRDSHHSWATAVLTGIDPPLLTCESVISEACFLLRRIPDGPGAVLELVRRGLIEPSFRLVDESAAIVSLVSRFASVPMSLADACLVRMAELLPESQVLTCDSDFRIYRYHGRRQIKTWMPHLE